MVMMKSEGMRTFERTLRAKISSLDFEGCHTLLESDFAVRGDELSPIFISICHEKAIWKTVALKFDVDLEEEGWNEDELSKVISTKEDNLLSAGYMKKTGIANGLAKVAVERIFEQFIRLFMDYGYKIDATDFSGHTALHHAIKYGFRSTVKLLIESGADLSIRAVVASWIRVKLPAIYHSLYALDEEATRIVLKHCDEGNIKMELEKIDEFVYLPKNIPETITKYLQKLNELTPLNFLLIILIIKTYGNPNINSHLLGEMVNIGKNLSVLFHRCQIHLKAPEPLLNFYTNALTSMSQHGFCKDKFFSQLISSLYNVDAEISV